MLKLANIPRSTTCAELYNYKQTYHTSYTSLLLPRRNRRSMLPLHNLPTCVMTSQFTELLTIPDLLDLRITSRWGKFVADGALGLSVTEPSQLYKRTIPKEWVMSDLVRLRATMEHDCVKLIKEETLIRRLKLDLLVYRNKKLCGSLRSNNDWYFTSRWLQATTDWLVDLDSCNPLKNISKHCLHCSFCGKDVCDDNLVCGTKMATYYARLMPHRVWSTLRRCWTLTENLCLPPPRAG